MNLAELAVKIKVDGAETAKRNLHGVRDALGQTAAKAGELASRARGVGDFLRGVAGGAASTTAALLGVQAALFGVVAVAGFNTAKSMDSLTRGLASVSTDAGDLTAQLGRLKEVAKLPGLGFEEAVQGSLALQSAGLSANLAERSLKAFGNALASVGKGKADLDGVTLALSQMASKGKVSAEEINQINERVPQIRAALNAAFGTSDGEAINALGLDVTQVIGKIVSELEKLPAVSGGVGNAIENIGDRAQAVLLPLGKGLTSMFTAAEPGLMRLFDAIEVRTTAIGEVLQAVGKSGVLAETLGSILGLTDAFDKASFQEGAINIIAGIMTAVGNVPTAIAQVQKYATDLFTTLGNNATATGVYIGERLAEVWERLGKFIQGTIQGLVAGIAKYAPIVGEIVAGIALEVAKATPQGAALNALFGDSKVATPVYQSLPDLPDVVGTLTKGSDEKAARIRAALSPLSELPDGLNYGGGAKGGTSPVQSALEAIETNTARTADALSLRRQIAGGGELGRLGVTPSELFGGGVSGAATGDRWAQLADMMRRAAQDEARKVNGATAGSYTTFRPRSV